MMQLGDWADLEVSGLQLSMREELEMIESYIPQYFEDDAPLGIMLSGAFMYTPGPDSDFNRLCRTTVGEIRDRNRKLSRMQIRGPLYGELQELRASRR